MSDQPKSPWHRWEMIGFNILMFGILIICLTFALEAIFLSFVPLGGRFAFVIAADDTQLQSISEAMNSTGAFVKVYTIADDSLQKKICDTLKTEELPRVRAPLNCTGKAVAIVTHSTYAVVIALLSNSSEIGDELADDMIFKRVSDGYIDVYLGGRKVGYVKGYEKFRIFWIYFWDPVGVGSRVDSLVERYRNDMYESAGVTFREEMVDILEKAQVVGLSMFSLGCALMLCSRIADATEKK